ncbi:MAG: protein kinase domain-containing protein, partial [Vicinamibacterales bacterium]
MPALTHGTRLGPYEIETPLGSGGMGEVYRARDTRLDRIVALKVLSAGLAEDHVSRERFEREARAISSLNHPNICVLHDIGHERPRPASGSAVTAEPSDDPTLDFLVMEYLEGETLAARLARGPARVTRGALTTRTSTNADVSSDSADRLGDSAAASAATSPPMSVDEAVGIAIQIVSALDRAHRQGIVHRDLKPGNVMLTKPVRGGQPMAGSTGSSAHVKLLDFGLARLTRAGTPDKKDGLGHGLVSLADLSMPTMSSPLTMKGTILGTLQYMSPEQLEGKDVDARADIFAFGAVLYEMLTGRRPFEGKSQASLIGAILDHEPTSVGTLHPGVPPILEELVTRCLAKDRDDRWQTMRDLARQLELVSRTKGDASPARSSTAPRLRTRLGAVTAALVAGAIIAGSAVAWRLWPTTTAPPIVSRFTLDLPEGQSFTRTGRHAVALSPDGSRLIYVANAQLYLRAMNELSVVAISGTENSNPTEPVFSPDSQWVAFYSNGQLRKIRAAGGTPISLCAASNPFGMSWIGDRILFGQDEPRGIVEVPASGGAPRVLIALDASKGELGHGPQLIASGAAVLFTLRKVDAPWDNSDIVVQDLQTGRRTTVISGGTDGRVLPTGHLTYGREATLFAIRFDEASLVAVGEAVPVLTGVLLRPGPVGGSGAVQAVMSGSGSMAFIPGWLSIDRRFVWVTGDGVEQSASAPRRPYGTFQGGFRVAPDGRRVAVVVRDETASETSGGGTDIWVWDIARGTLTRLTFD